MSCQDVRERFSELIDDALDAGARGVVEAHVAGCAECRRELDRLERTVALLRSVEPVRAPVGFVDRVLEAATPVPWYRRVTERLARVRPLGVPVEAAALVLVATLAVFVFERTPELQRAAREETAPSLLGERPDVTSKPSLGPTIPQRSGPDAAAVRQHTWASDTSGVAREGDAKSDATNEPAVRIESEAVLATGETAPRRATGLTRGRAGSEDAGSSASRQDAGPGSGRVAPPHGARSDLAARLRASDASRESAMPEPPGAAREPAPRADAPGAGIDLATRSDPPGATRTPAAPADPPRAAREPATRSDPPGATRTPAPRADPPGALREPPMRSETSGMVRGPAPSSAPLDTSAAPSTRPAPPGAMRDPAVRSDAAGAPESARSPDATAAPREPVARPDASGPVPTAPAPVAPAPPGMRQKSAALPDSSTNVGSSPEESRPRRPSPDEPAGSAPDAIRRPRAVVPPATPRSATVRSAPRITGRLAVADQEAAGRDLTALLSRVGGAELGRRTEGPVVVVDVMVPGPRYALFSSGLARIGTWTPDASPSDSPAELIVTLRMTR